MNETPKNVSITVGPDGVSIKGPFDGYELSEVLRTAEETWRGQRDRRLRYEALAWFARFQAAWPIVAMLWLMVLVAAFWPQPSEAIEVKGYELQEVATNETY